SAAMQQKLLTAQLLYARQATAALQIVGEVAHAVNVRLQEIAQSVHILLGREPAADVLLVGKIFARHVAGVTAVGNLADGIDAEERNDGAAGIAADVVARDETLASDDETLGPPSQVE